MASSPLKLAPQMQNGVRRNRRGSLQSDDTALSRQIRETHALGRSQILDVKPILHVIDEIFHRSAVAITDGGILLGTHVDALEDRTSSLSHDVLLQGLSYLIQKIYIEISCQSLAGADLHVSTMELLRSLSNYSWEAKVVLCLAAFSVYYGEIWLVAQLCTTNALAKPVAILKELTHLIEHAASLKPQLEAIDNLIKAITKVTKLIVEYSNMVKLQSQYISEDTPPLSVAMAHIPAAAYSAIRSILACASHIAVLTGDTHEYVASSTTEAFELSSLAHKLNNIHEHLTSELQHCRRYIVEKRYDEDYKNLIHIIRSLHLDNMKILRALISHKDDTQPLVIGNSQVRFSLEVLRRKHVLLLITDLSLSNEEILILEHIHKDQQHRAEVEYEFVWLPIVDTDLWDEAKRDKFQDLKSRMSWYTVHDPLIIETPVIKFIRDYWHFDKKMIVVSLDPQGRVLSENAFHMMWIWGNVAYPFSDERETALWNAESWRLELVADGIDQEILKWIDQGKYICLYGSDDIEWIRKFTERAKDVARRAEIPLELVYAGRSTATREKIRKLNRTIDAENLSRTWSDYTSTWFFWSRLDSMRCSKAKHEKTVDNDSILREVMTLLSYDGSDQGWVMVWRGSAETVRGDGHLTSTTLDDFESWRPAAAEIGFVPELRNQLKLRHQPRHCIRLIIPGFGPDIPDRVVCTECDREMEKFFMFRCCTD